MSAEKTISGSMSHHRRSLVLLGGVVLSAAVLWRVVMPPAGASTAPETPLVSIELPTSSEGALPDNQTSIEVAKPTEPEVVGVWDDDFYGKRRMTFCADGTATMTLELDPVSRLLYGPRLLFKIAWERIDNRLLLKMSGGDPPEATKTLARLFGESSEQTIEVLTADEMHLRSSDSGKLYVHRRVVDVAASDTSQP